MYIPECAARGSVHQLECSTERCKKCITKKSQICMDGMCSMHEIPLSLAKSKYRMTEDEA
jgi:phosphoribosyl 1,2-cyclic phosphodiesterase